MGARKPRKPWHDVRDTKPQVDRQTYSADDCAACAGRDCSSDDYSEDEQGHRRYKEGRRRQWAR
eukprot:6468849-Amphidinium_carterae.1